MFISQDFKYNDISSTNYNVSIVRVNSGMLEMPFGTSREIIEEKILLRPLPYLYGVDEKVMSFEITISKSDGGFWENSKRREIVRWLFQNNYKPFESPDYPGLALYCMPVGDPRRFDNTLKQGYATIQFRCNAPWFYNYPKLINYMAQDVYGFNNSTPTVITLESKSNVAQGLYVYPEITFELLDDTTSFTIKNNTVMGEIFQFTNLTAEESIYVNNEKKQIVSSFPNTYRYNNFNKKWLRLIQGINILEVTGKVNLEVKLQYPVAL